MKLIRLPCWSSSGFRIKNPNAFLVGFCILSRL